MQRLRLDQDIKPLSEFRANAASLVQQVRETQRPLVLTQRGHSSAVLLAIGEYERLIEKLEVLQDIQESERQIANGEGIPHQVAKARILGALDR